MPERDPDPNTDAAPPRDAAGAGSAGPDRFLQRATKRATTAESTPSPWSGIALTIGAPVATIVVGYNLLLAINIGDGSAAYSMPRYAAVRTALTAALERDLTPTRLEEILIKTEDPLPYVAPPKAIAAEVEKGRATRGRYRRHHRQRHDRGQRHHDHLDNDDGGRRLIFAAVMDDIGTTTIQAGTGFTARGTLSSDLSTEDRVMANPGAIAGTWTFGAAHRDIARVVAFRCAGG